MKQAELHVMRSISDSLTALTKRFDRMDGKQDEMSTILTRMDAQDVRGALKDHIGDYRKFLDERQKEIPVWDARIKTLELTVARYSGVMLPISIVAAGMLGAFGSFLVAHFVGK